MRISTEQVWRSSLADVQAATVRSGQAQAQISSGRRIERSSDDPTGAHRASGMRAGAEAIDQYLRAGDDAVGIMVAQDSVLQTVLTRMTVVEELAIASANETNSNEAREAAAVQLEEIRAERVPLANTSHSGRALFGGFQGTAVDDSGPTVTLVGDSGEVRRRIADDQILTVNVTADDVFGYSSGRSLFDVIDDVIADTRAADVASLGTTRLDELAAARQSVNNGLGVIGSRVARVETTMGDLTGKRDALNAGASDLVNADLAEATVQFSEANLAYEAALAVTAQLNRVSLLSYL